MTVLAPSSYTARDYTTARTELASLIARTQAGAYSDYFEASLGMVMVDLFAAVVDTTSWNVDASVLEGWLATCRRYESALYFARSVGYVPQGYTAAVAAVVSTTALPQNLVNAGVLVKAGSSLRGSNGLTYEVLEDTTFQPGTATLRMYVSEGASYVESFQPVSVANYSVTTQQKQVAQDSWSVFVGDTSLSTNEWTQVPNVLLETTPSYTYDVNYDVDGRLIVRFGDGTSGAIPSQAITLRYRTSNGASGNAAAKTITGSITVYDATNTSAPVPVSFINYAAQNTSVGSPQLQTNEIVGTFVNSSTQNGLLAHAPIQPSTLTLTLSLATGDVIVLKSNADGTFTQQPTAAPYNLISASSRIYYNTGAYVIVFDSIFPAGGNAVADYYYSPSVDPTAVTVTGAATGGADRETLDQLRVNIPAYVRTPTSVVSLEDYANFINRIPGISRSGVRVETSGGAYTRNIVNVYLWGYEDISFTSVSTSGAIAAAPYKRFATASSYQVHTVARQLREKSILTLQHVIQNPGIMWLDLYLGSVRYDKRLNAQVVRQSITDAIVNYIQGTSGYEVRLADVTAAAMQSQGVLSFNIQRAATGHHDVLSTSVSQGVTNGTASFSGTIDLEDGAILSPGTVFIELAETPAPIVLQDTASGSFAVTSSNASVVSSSISYDTGVWTVTLATAPTTGISITAAYADVINDYRFLQTPVINSPSAGDYWPPPIATQSLPVATPPYKDGVYLSPSTNTYAPLQDIIIQSIFESTYFYDNSFLYNGSIYYNASDTVVVPDFRVINLRKLHFDLVGV